MANVSRDAILQAVNDLPDESLEELQALINYLRYKHTHPGSAWFRAIYDVFEPVRRGVEESGMTEDEINTIIDEAVEEVRQEHYEQRLRQEKRPGS